MPWALKPQPLNVQQYLITPRNNLKVCHSRSVQRVCYYNKIIGSY